MSVVILHIKILKFELIKKGQRNKLITIGIAQYIFDYLFIVFYNQISP